MARTARSRSSADCRGKQDRQQRRDPTAAAPAPASAATSTTADGAREPITPAEYVYRTMLPPSKPSPPGEAAEELLRPATLGKRDRCDTGGSSAGPMLSMDLFLNSDDLQQVDLGDLMGGMFSSGDVAMKSLQSSDIVQSMLLPDVEKTAAGALKGSAEPRPPQPRKAAPQSQPQASNQRTYPGEEPNRAEDDACPIDGLAARMQRISTGDDIVPLDEIIPISSSTLEWREGLGEADLGPMDPSLFANNRALRNPSPAPLSKSAPANSYAGDSDCSEHDAPLEGSRPEDWERLARLAASPLADNPPPLNPSYRAPPSRTSPPPPPPSDPAAAAPAARGPPGWAGTPPDAKMPPQDNQSRLTSDQVRAMDNGMARDDNQILSLGGQMYNGDCNLTAEQKMFRDNGERPERARNPGPRAGASSSSSTASKRRKKKGRKREIDESVAVTPTEDDVLFGRGGFTNTHPGNVRFRAKALELRSWYEQPTTTKEEKYDISGILVESVRGAGHRFLERGSDGLWHEVVGNGARKKASQALRERVRRQRRSGGSAGGSRSSPSQAGDPGAKDDAGSVVSSDVVGV